MRRRGGLGRGLEALIPSNPLTVILRAAWNQCVQSTAKATTASHQLAPSPVGASKPLRSASSKVRSR